MEVKVENVLGVFLVVCGGCGLLSGCVGLGFGLMFLAVPQAIGISMLSVGAGAFLAASCGAKWIIRTIGQTIRDMPDE